MVARRKNGLEVHSSRLQPYPGQNHHGVSEELPEWVRSNSAGYECCRVWRGPYTQSKIIML